MVVRKPAYINVVPIVCISGIVVVFKRLESILESTHKYIYNRGRDMALTHTNIAVNSRPATNKLVSAVVVVVVIRRIDFYSHQRTLVG